MTPVASDPSSVLARFALAGQLRSWAAFGDGHINDTFRVRTSSADYLVQRLNPSVFRDGPAVMENISRVLAHLARTAPADGVLALVPTTDGRPWLMDAQGCVWRAYPFISPSATLERVDTGDQAHAVARAFAGFLARLADLPGGPLHEVIPDFHHTPKRVSRLEDAIRRDACGRLAGAAAAVEQALAASAQASILLDAQAAGGLQAMATHNDTKIGNLLMTGDGRRARCVIDLDTLMPGLPLYDFGDLVRTAVCSAAEDADPAEMVPRPRILRALADGWLEGRGDACQRDERRLMIAAGALMTYECGIRFLTDHLDGDRYYRIKREGHNLARARAQLALAARLFDMTAPSDHGRN